MRLVGKRIEEYGETFWISDIYVQVKETYPTDISYSIGKHIQLATATYMRSEQTMNRDAKIPGGTINLTKQTSVYKWCVSRHLIRNIHVAFQSMITKEIILTETIF